MLIGQYEAKIDEKNRLALPKRFREILGNRIITTLGYENSLIIVSVDSWRNLLAGTEGRPFIESATRETQRFLLGGASELELDTKGRFVLPSYLRSFGRIEGEVIFLGLSKYVEVWDKKRWEEYRGNLEKNIDRISKRLVDQNRKDRENG